MRKRVIGIIAFVFIICAMILIAGCSAKTKRLMKDVQSNYGGLDRTVIAYTMNGEQIGEWRGKIDIDASEDNKVKFDLDGKRTIIYNAIVIAQEN